MIDRSAAVQQALYGTITSQLGVSIPVYDVPPENANYPHIVIGGGQILDAGTKTYDGQQHYVDLHIWSVTTGFKQSREIISALYLALHNVNLSVVGANTVHCRVDSITGPVLDADGRILHTVVTISVETQN